MPFLATAKRLRERNIAVTFLTNKNWAELVKSVGATFVEISDPDPCQDGRDDFGFFLSHTLPSFARSFSYIEERHRAGVRCVLVYRINMLGAECAAIKYNLPNIKIALQPSAIRSFELPPWPLMKLTQGPLGAISKRYLLPALFAFAERRYRKRTNGFRESVGIAPLPGFGTPPGLEDLLLLMCPQWFSLPQRDWPGTVRFAGFPYFDVPYAPEKDLENFIRDHGKPLVFTAGTGVKDAHSLFSAARAVCAELRRPGIFLGGGIAPSNSCERILVKSFVELNWLLPRSALLVHHGGIGTTAQAIRAGVPQCIIPGRFDQPDNAFRVAVFGLGGVIFSKKPSANDLTDAIRSILDAPKIQEISGRAAELVRAEDGIDRACKAVVELADGRGWTVPYPEREPEGQPI